MSDPRPILAHHVAGDGPPLVLLNGGLMTIAAWYEVAPPLESRFRVVRCDFRGQLLTPGPAPSALADHAADIAALLDHLGLGPVHLVGTSFGAEVAACLAADQPERAASLVLITATDRVTPELWQRGAGMRQACDTAATGSGDGGRVFDLLAESTFSPAWAAEHRDLLAERRRQVAALPPVYFRGLRDLLTPLQDLDLRPRLARIACPALVVAAELDETFPGPCSRDLAAAIPGARLEVVAGSGHGLVIEKPRALTEILLGFLDERG